MSLRIQTIKKIHIIIFKDSGESGDKVQYDIKTTKHLVTCTMLVDTTL